jgi:hypothetical protein
MSLLSLGGPFCDDARLHNDVARQARALRINAWRRTSPFDTRRAFDNQIAALRARIGAGG